MRHRPPAAAAISSPWCRSRRRNAATRAFVRRDGPRLAALPLPYAIPAPSAPRGRASSLTRTEASPCGARAQRASMSTTGSPRIRPRARERIGSARSPTSRREPAFAGTLLARRDDPVDVDGDLRPGHARRERSGASSTLLRAGARSRGADDGRRAARRGIAPLPAPLRAARPKRDLRARPTAPCASH